jgi:hypothetical protein
LALNSSILFREKLVLVLWLLGGESDILSTVGSWKQEKESDTLSLLDAYIFGYLTEKKDSINVEIYNHVVENFKSLPTDLSSSQLRSI